MAVPLRMKRMARERVTLENPNDDYFVRFEDDNLLRFYAYVIGPSDTLYAHKFVKLRFDIPDGYPLVRSLASKLAKPSKWGELTDIPEAPYMHIHTIQRRKAPSQFIR